MTDNRNLGAPPGAGGDPNAAMRQYFNGQISVREAVAVLDADVPTPEFAEPSIDEQQTSDANLLLALSREPQESNE